MSLKSFKDIVGRKAYNVNSEDRQIFEKEISKTDFGNSDYDLIEFVLYDSSDNKLPQGDNGEFVRYINLTDDNIRNYFIIPDGNYNQTQNDSSEFIIDIEKLVREAGYSNGTFKTQVTLLNRRVGTENDPYDRLWIHEISPSRTEIRVLPIQQDNHPRPDLIRRYNIFVNNSNFKDDTYSDVYNLIRKINIQSVIESFLKIKGMVADGQNYIELIQQEFDIVDFDAFITDLHSKLIESFDHFLNGRVWDVSNINYGKPDEQVDDLELSIDKAIEVACQSLEIILGELLPIRDIIDDPYYDDVREGCTDPSAKNYDEFATINVPSLCIYEPVDDDPPVDVVELCETPGAINIGEPLPCIFPDPPPVDEPIEVCEDENATNTGQEGPCTYPLFTESMVKVIPNVGCEGTLVTGKVLLNGVDKTSSLNARSWNPDRWGGLYRVSVEITVPNGYSNSGTNLRVGADGTYSAYAPGTNGCPDVVKVVRGCTDPNANNYNSNATEDNGTCAYDPDFTCAIANPKLNGGDSGDTVSVTLQEGILASGITPSKYVEGSQQYSFKIRIPSGYKNSGGTISCNSTYNAPPKPPVLTEFTCDNTLVSVIGGTVGEPVTGTVTRGTLNSNSWSPSTYKDTSTQYSVSIRVPSGYTNSGDNITCKTTFYTAQPKPEMTCQNALLTVYSGEVGKPIQGEVLGEGRLDYWGTEAYGYSTYQPGTVQYGAVIKVTDPKYSNYDSHLQCSAGFATATTPVPEEPTPIVDTIQRVGYHSGNVTIPDGVCMGRDGTVSAANINTVLYSTATSISGLQGSIVYSSRNRDGSGTPLANGRYLVNSNEVPAGRGNYPSGTFLMEVSNNGIVGSVSRFQCTRTSTGGDTGTGDTGTGDTITRESTDQL